MRRDEIDTARQLTALLAEVDETIRGTRYCYGIGVTYVAGSNAVHSVFTSKRTSSTASFRDEGGDELHEFMMNFLASKRAKIVSKLQSLGVDMKDDVEP